MNMCVWESGGSIMWNFKQISGQVAMGLLTVRAIDSNGVLANLVYKKF